MSSSKKPSSSNTNPTNKKDDTNKKSDSKETTTPTVAPQPPPPLTMEQRLQEILSILKKAGEQRDSTLVARALRKTTVVRQNIKIHELSAIIKTYMTPGITKDELLELLQSQPDDTTPATTSTTPAAMDIVTEPSSTENTTSSAMDIVTTTSSTTTSTPPLPSSTSIATKPITHLPEIDMYLHLLSLRIVWKRNLQLANENELFFKNIKSLMTSTINTSSFKSCEILASRSWSLYALVCEYKNIDIHNELIAGHRAACLRLDDIVQATLTNLILRDFIKRDQIMPATKFANKVRFPDHVSNNQHARYLYYLGRIEALQLEYGKSLSYLQQSIRKTSSSGRNGLGFRIAVHKLCTVVLLLTGEMPDRQWFSDNEMSHALAPYFELCKAVKSGSVAEFEACRDLYRDTFMKDKTFTLCYRLHSSVIKTGLRAINAAFSRISFMDVAKKLDLGNDSAAAEAAEYLCAKAIRDGVLNAYIDGESNCLVYSESVDLYSSTSEPAHAFNRRVNFLLDAHNEAVKAMRFPPETYKSLTKHLNEDDGDNLDVDLEDLEDLEDDGMDD
jgi:26S proteasome regulatory subunit N3